MKGARFSGPAEVVRLYGVLFGKHMAGCREVMETKCMFNVSGSGSLCVGLRSPLRAFLQITV